MNFLTIRDSAKKRRQRVDREGAKRMLSAAKLSRASPPLARPGGPEGSAFTLEDSVDGNDITPVPKQQDPYRPPGPGPGGRAPATAPLPAADLPASGVCESPAPAPPGRPHHRRAPAARPRAAPGVTDGGPARGRGGPALAR